ncbi:MAG: hypothetical protein NT169_09790 [Chloroflexi bacterium]|nr:hypothetical protein [Chloroflexota bacterium]
MSDSTLSLEARFLGSADNQVPFTFIVTLRADFDHDAAQFAAKKQGESAAQGTTLSR